MQTFYLIQFYVRSIENFIIYMKLKIRFNDMKTSFVKVDTIFGTDFEFLPGDKSKTIISAKPLP